MDHVARVGCSGWQYKHWRNDFYPAGLPQTRWFDYYASQFDTVEINNTFYRLPEKQTFADWEKPPCLVDQLHLFEPGFELRGWPQARARNP